MAARTGDGQLRPAAARAHALLHAHGDAPDNENEVFFFSASFSRTLDAAHADQDGGKSRGDNHEMWIDPTNGDRMAVVNDGGEYFVDRGNSWNHVNLPIAQMYHVTVDDQIPYYVYGNRQTDRLAWPSNSLHSALLRNSIRVAPASSAGARAARVPDPRTTTLSGRPDGSAALAQ